MSISERFDSLSLRWQVCLLVGTALVVCLLITGTLAYSHSRDAIIDLTLDKIMAETSEAASDLDHVLRSTRLDATTTPTFPPIPGMIRCWDNDGTKDTEGNSTIDDWIGRLTTILSAQMNANPERVRCTVYDESGSAVMRVVSYGGDTKLITTDMDSVADEDYFVRALKLKRGDTYVAPIQSEGEDVYLRVCSPCFKTIESTDRDARAVLVIALDGKAIIDKAATYVTSGDVLIVDQSGTFLHPRRSDAIRYADQYPVRAAKMASTDPAADTYREFIAGGDRDGEALVATYRKFYYQPNDRSRFWVIAPSVSAKSALTHATALARSIMTVGIVVLLSASVVAFLLLGRLTLPLQRLAGAADLIAKGQLETELPKARPLGEVKALYSSIGSMTTNLRDMLAAASSQGARTKAIFNSTADAIVTIDEQGNILTCNATAESLFGHSTGSLIGQKASVIVPSLYQEDASYAKQALSEGEMRQVGDEVETTGRHRDGSSVPLAMRVTELEHVGQRMFIATMQDITIRQQARAEREKLSNAIRGAVSRLAAGTQQILATTTEQATGAQQQAAAVSETVATVDEVAQTADQAAERATAVAEAARRAEEVGRAGRHAVDESVASMDTMREQVQSIAENILSLAERAQAIGEIIATVSDIAEQTNILALNAAVEASRAGEHGKGFAVVATEVKALAAQSKKATMQVRQILGEIQQAMNTAVLSTEKGTDSVTRASQVVGQTGDTIKTLEEMLGHSARTATQISASASQQATGVIQLNEAIKNIDRVTQQNVEAIQQIEASAHSLNTLSNELAGLTANG